MTSDDDDVRNSWDKAGECRARSDCTYVQADLVIHFSQNNSMVADS